MKRSIDFGLVSKLVIAVMISSIMFFLFSNMLSFGEAQAGRRVAGVTEIIQKALVQCYALEGSYPSSIDYVEKYGVVLDKERFVYYYQYFGGNLRPTIVVIER